MKKMSGKEGWRRWKLEEEVGKISKDELRKALKGIKNGKAVGPDDILIEVWKCLEGRAVEILTKLFNMFLDSENIP